VGEEYFSIIYYDYNLHKFRRFYPDFIVLNYLNELSIYEVKGTQLLYKYETIQKYKYLLNYKNKQNMKINIYSVTKYDIDKILKIEEIDEDFINNISNILNKKIKIHKKNNKINKNKINSIKEKKKNKTKTKYNKNKIKTKLIIEIKKEPNLIEKRFLDYLNLTNNHIQNKLTETKIHYQILDQINFMNLPIFSINNYLKNN
jgi:hypothetical protein